MMELDEDARFAFAQGILYERTRILENLRLAMLPALTDLLHLIEADDVPEGVPVIELEQIIDWSLSITQQPIHSPEEAMAVAKEGVAMSGMTAAEIKEAIDRINEQMGLDN